MEKILINILFAKPDGLLISYGVAKKFRKLLSINRMPFILRCDYYSGLVTPNVRPPELEEYTILIITIFSQSFQKTS